MQAPAPSGAWIIRPRLSAHVRLRLFCIPHAGGGPSFFRPWLNDLPAEIELGLIHLPGREGRLAEAPLADLPGLVQTLAAHLRPYLDRPFALYGHSLGALIAFELSRQLRREGGPLPAQLCLAAMPAPHLPSDGPPMHALPEMAFVAAIRQRYASIPEEVAGDAELRALLLPALRADLTVLETYAYQPEEPLDCPLSVFGGLDDTTVSREQLGAWRDHTRGRCVVRMFPGGHFFPEQARAFLLPAIVQDLSLHFREAQA